jgi:hypothetical protein
MTVWTIDADAGTGGRAIAAALAERAGVHLLDEELTSAMADALGTAREDALAYERSGPSLAARLGLAVGMATGVSPELAYEVRCIENVRKAMLDVVRTAASLPCVVYGRCSHVALALHPGAVHARIWAPAAWRSTRIAAELYIDSARARRAVAGEDRRRRRLRKWLTKGAGDGDGFHLVCDARRLGHDAIVELLLAAGGVTRADGLETVASRGACYGAEIGSSNGLCLTPQAARSGSSGRGSLGHRPL